MFRPPSVGRAPRLRIGRCAMAVAITAGALVTTSVTPAAAVAGVTTSFRPLESCRLLDTRDGSRAKPVAGEVLLVAARGQCGISADATAVAVTVIVTEPAANGFITAWPSGEPMPLASTSSYATGDTRANGALLSLGVDGNLAMFTLRSAHLIVDVSGEFDPAASASAGRFVPSTPLRALDSRDSGAAALAANSAVTVPLPAGVPSDAVALAVVLTITDAASAGFVTAYSAGAQRPITSSVNTDAARQTRTATQIVPVSAAGLTVFSNAGGHLIVDVVGYFTGESSGIAATGLFVPATPVRVLDTRGSVQVHAGGTVLAATAGVTGADASAIAANVTVTQSGPAGYVTAWPARTAQPLTPTVSYDKRNDTVANLGLIALSSAGIALASTSGTHVLVDITGWFTGAPLPLTTEVPGNVGVTRPEPTGPTGCLQHVPAPSADGVYQVRIGTNQTVVHIFTAGPNGPIAMVGDSLTYGSAPQTARALRSAGWGPICIDGTISRSVEFGSSSIPTGLSAVARIKASAATWADPTITWVVALGTNDVGFSGGNLARSDQYIAHMRAAIGATAVTWVNVRTNRPDFQFKEAMFNESLINSGMPIIDWYGAANGQGWIGGDRVHLGSVGYQARADLVARTVQTR